MAIQVVTALLDYVHVSTILVFFVVFLLAWAWLTKPRTDIPGPPSLPLVGNLLTLIFGIPKGELHKYFQKLRKEHGDIYRLYMGQKLCVVLNTHELINEAYVKQGDIVSDRPHFLPTGPGDGVIWTNGTIWKTLRRFSLQALRDFGMGKTTLEDTIQEEVTAMLDDLEKTKGEPITAKPYMMSSVSNIIHSICFGFRYSHDDKHFQKILAFWEKVFQNSAFFTANPLRVLFNFIRNKLYKNILRRHLDSQILEHTNTFDDNHIRDFIDLYIKINKDNTEDNEIFTHANLYRSIIDLFAAGTETTATSLDWALLFMIEYPDIQTKCRKEIENVIGVGRRVHWADRTKLPYTEAVILEVLRYSSLLPLGVPHLTAEEVTISNHVIPKGTMILANQQAVHFDPQYWEEPIKFNPERFLDLDGTVKKIDKLIPFSIGPRVCLGESLAKMEMFMFFSNLIQRFTFSKADKSDKLDFDGRLGVTLATKPYKLRAHLN